MRAKAGGRERGWGARVGESEGGGSSEEGECEGAVRAGACTDKGRVDEFIAQPDGLEDLRAVVRREQRDADLGENLEPARLERLAHLWRGGCEVGGDRVEGEDQGAGAGAVVGVRGV